MGLKERTLSLKAFLDKAGFSKNLSEMKSELQQSEKQFQVTASEVKAYGSDIDVLEARQKYLTETIGKQKPYVDELARALDAARSEMGADSKVAQALEGQLRSATIRYNNLQGEVRNVTGKLDEHRRSLEETKRAEEQQGKAANQAADSMQKFMDAAGHTSELNRFNTEMQKTELQYKLAASEARAYGTKADELKTKQKYLGDALQTQRRIIGTLTDAYDQARAETGRDSKATDELGTELRKARIRYNDLNAEIRDTSKEMQDETDATKESSMGWKDWVKGAVLGGVVGGTVGKVLSVLGGILGSVGNTAKSAFGILGEGIRAAISAMGTLAKKFSDLVMASSSAADETLTMAAKMGLSAETVQELQYATELVDVDLETMAGSMSKLTVNVGKAADQEADYAKKQQEARKHHKKYKGELGDQAKAFKDLGVKIKDSKGQLRDSEDVWFDVITALGKVKNETKQDLLANKLFGKSYAELKPLIDAGGDSLKKLAKEAKKNGYILSEDQLKNLGELDDAYQKFQKTMDGTRNVLAATVAPAFTKFFEILVANAPEIQKELTPAMEDLGSALGDAVTDLAPAIPGFIRLGTEVVPVITDALRTAEPYVAQVLKKIPGILESVGAALDGMPQKTIIALGELAVNGLPALADAAVKCAPSIGAIISTISDNREGLTEAVITLANTTPTFVEAFADFVKNVAPVLIEIAPDVAKAFVTIAKPVAELLSLVLALQAAWTGGWVKAFDAATGADKKTPNGMGGGSTPGLASGGIAAGGMTLTGEAGPELSVLPRGTHVFSAGETKAMLGASRQGQKEVHHSGTIRIEGVTQEGKEEIYDYMIDRIVQEVRLG